MICDCGNHAWAPLTRGFVVLVSPEDAHLLSKKWCAVKARGLTHYARRNLPPTTKGKGTQKRKQETMHRVILKPGPGYVVDHINMNGLDNRRSNIRLCTEYQNRLNRPGWRHKKIPLKGVRKQSEHSFAANIGFNNRLRYLGSFPTAEEAHAAYLAASIALHGEFGRSK